MGDFNLHHELWAGSHVARIEPEAEGLVEMSEEYDLTNMLAPGTITYEEGQKQSTIDLCLVTGARWTTVLIMTQTICLLEILELVPELGPALVASGLEPCHHLFPMITCHSQQRP